MPQLSGDEGPPLSRTVESAEPCASALASPLPTQPYRIHPPLVLPPDFTLSMLMQPCGDYRSRYSRPSRRRRSGLPPSRYRNTPVGYNTMTREHGYPSDASEGEPLLEAAHYSTPQQRAQSAATPGGEEAEAETENVRFWSRCIRFLEKIGGWLQGLFQGRLIWRL